MKRLPVLFAVLALVAGNAHARRWVPFEPGAPERAAAAGWVRWFDSGYGADRTGVIELSSSGHHT